MTSSKFIIMLSLALCVLATIAFVARAQQSENLLLIDQPVDHDLYAAQREINVQSTVNGDLVAAGQRVTVDGNVAGDIIVAAQNIEIRSTVNDDLRAAGQYIRVQSPVLGHIVAAGKIVTIEQSIGDWAWLAGNTVEVNGSIGSDLKVRAKKITINAEVAGDVDLIGEQLDLGPKAVVRGDLNWRSQNEANINPDAQIYGEFIKGPLPEFVEELRAADRYSLPVNVVVAVIVLFLLFSRPLRASADQVVKSPGRSLLFGLAAFSITPFLAALLFLSSIGFWLGFAVLFMFLALLIVGVLTGLFVISDIVLRRFHTQPAMWQSIASILITVVIAGLLIKVPWLGVIGAITILLIGLGALCWNAWATKRNFEHHGLQTS